LAQAGASRVQPPPHCSLVNLERLTERLRRFAQQHTEPKDDIKFKQLCLSLNGRHIVCQVPRQHDNCSVATAINSTIMPSPHPVGGERSPKVQPKSGKTIEEKRSRNTGGGSSARDIAVEEEIRELLSKAGDLGDGATGSDQGSYRDATKLYEKATGLAEKYYGNAREETLNIRGWWAASLRRTGDLKKAITCDLKNVEWALEGLKQCQHASGTNSAEILSAKERHLDFQRRLARSYLANQQPAWAIPIFRTVAAADVTISAEQNCKDRVDLASALFESGTDQHIMEAVDLNISTLKSTEKALGNDHIETVKVRYNLGRELYELKKYNDALKKFGELLKILKAKNCKAKAAPDYREILEDTEVSLMNCSERVARQEGKIKPQNELEAETKRRGEEYRREMVIRVEEAENHMARQKKMAEQQSLSMTEEKRRNAELRGQVVEQLQVKEKSAQREEKKTAKQKSKEGTRQQGIDKEVQRQLAEQTQAEEVKGTQRRLETQTAEGSSEKDQRKVKGQQEKKVLYAKLQDIDSRASTPKDRKGKEVERPKKVDHDGAGQQKREREREDPGREQSHARTATTKPTKSSNPDERAQNAWQDIKRKPSEQTSKTVKPRITDATKPLVGTSNELPRNQSSTSARGDSSPLTEANLRQLPSHQRSASARAASNSLTEANMRQLQRSKSTRSNANKTTRSGGPDNFGGVTRHVKPDRTIEKEREQAFPVSEFAVPTRVNKNEVPDKPRKERHANELSMVKSHLASVAEQATGKSDTSVKDRATDTRSPRADTNLKTPSEQRSLVTNTKSERDGRPKSALERTRPSKDDRASRRLSAPVTTPSERDSTGQGEDIQEKKRSTPSVVSETHGKIERQRPKSSQSHYRKDSSASTADQSTGPRSGSTESRQTKQSPGATSDLTPAAVQMTHFLESAGKATEPMKERKPDRPRQSSAKHDETGIADASKAFLDRSEDSCETAGPGVTPAMSRDDTQEPAFSLGDAENDVTIHTENGHTPPQINIVKEQMTDNTTSEIHSSKPVIITSTIPTDTTGTLAQFVPGGWHQDFDEPDHHRKPRRARSNDQEGLGGLRVSNIDDLAHRRASSVNLRRAHLYTAKTPLLRTWDPQESVSTSLEFRCA
jgi:tetratricopeptide (TPR) repeat protein